MLMRLMYTILQQSFVQQGSRVALAMKGCSAPAGQRRGMDRLHDRSMQAWQHLLAIRMLVGWSGHDSRYAVEVHAKQRTATNRFVTVQRPRTRRACTPFRHGVVTADIDTCMVWLPQCTYTRPQSTTRCHPSKFFVSNVPACVVALVGDAHVPSLESR